MKSIGVFLTLYKKSRTVVPLAVRNFKNETENPYFIFQYTLVQGVDSIIFQVLNDEGELLYQFIPQLENTNPGVYLIHWDGFDQEEVYDSQTFEGKILQAKIMVKREGLSKSFTLYFESKYKEVQWVDVKINRKTKLIEALIRTNIEDGGVQKISHWNKIPKADLLRIGKDPIKERERSFEDLVKLAKDGLQYYWGRNKNHSVAKNIIFENGDAYEFYLNINNGANKEALKSPKIIYLSNGHSRRSRNWEFSRILFYNTGFLNQSKKWYYKSALLADSDFKLITAHEIGHEILLAYGGHVYSKSHKGSSTIISQSPLGNYFYPKQGEIDLMVYYKEDPAHPFPADYIKRNAAAATDVLSLIWLTKIELTVKNV